MRYQLCLWLDPYQVLHHFHHDHRDPRDRRGPHDHHDHRDPLLHRALQTLFSH